MYAGSISKDRAIWWLDIPIIPNEGDAGDYVVSVTRDDPGMVKGRSVGPVGGYSFLAKRRNSNPTPFYESSRRFSFIMHEDACSGRAPWNFHREIRK